MNIETLLVNIAVVSIILVPYIAFIYLGHTQFNEIEKKFQQEVKLLGLHIDEYERWNMNVMGIDFNQKKILLVVRQNEKLLAEVIPLKKIIKSSIVTCTHLVKTGNKETTELDKIFLELTPFEGTDKTMVSLFYSGYTFEQDYEMKHAEKWNTLINSILEKPKAKEKAA
ncbi:MAG: hypothetical protein COZ75_00730 [Flavobacteriaceae bacterium CG_4_8_14_3_um_filter_34_10]|nr:MAG: hypothetical protein COZ75_00730 [Flavobacteriaceae bacterium CG_4_8_14_3_um_filter_34_10]